MTRLMTFHRVLSACEDGDVEAWKSFLANYSSMALHVFDVYSPWTSEARWEAWRDALRALNESDCAILKGFSHQSEREFLVGLRAFLQDSVGRSGEAPREACDPAVPSVQSLGMLLSGLPVVHQEIVFLTLAGYSQSSLERILRISPAVAGEGLARLDAKYPGVVEQKEDRCLWPTPWLAVCAAARASGEKDCTPLRQLIRILDGQASWYEKSPAEEHRAKCMHCLELWTSLLEVVAWDRTRQPWPAEKVAPLLAVVSHKQAKPKSLFARMLGRSS